MSTSVTILGLGAMGSALAARLPDPVLWNRNRGVPLAEALTRSTGPVVVCLFDHHSVHDVLDPVAAALTGRPVLNLTTTTPAESRELAAWAGTHGVPFLDGAILAVPEMIGGPGSSLFYSGDQSVFDSQRDLLGRWGESTYLGADAGRAALLDMAMLTGMYAMFGGFLQGAAMLAAEGVPVAEFARRQAPFLAAMTDGLTDYASTIDARDYGGAGQQSLRFTGTALAALQRATAGQGVPADLLTPMRDLVTRQIEAGHGDSGTARVFEALRSIR